MFGERLRRARTAAGLSMDGLAKHWWVCLLMRSKNMSTALICLGLRIC